MTVTVISAVIAFLLSMLIVRMEKWSTNFQEREKKRIQDYLAVKHGIGVISDQDRIKTVNSIRLGRSVAWIFRFTLLEIGLAGVSIFVPFWVAKLLTTFGATAILTSIVLFLYYLTKMIIFAIYFTSSGRWRKEVVTNLT